VKRDAMLLLAGRAAQAVLTIAAFRLLTAFLSPAEAGGIYLIISVATFFGMFALNPVFMYLGRKLFVWHDSKSIFEHLLGYNIYSIIVSLSVIPVVLGLWKFFGVGAGLPGLVFALIVACYTYTLNWNQVFIPFLNTLGHKSSFVLLTLVTSGLGLSFSVAAVHFSSPSAVSWMSGQIAGIGLSAVLGFYVFRQKVPEPQSAAWRSPGYANRAIFFNVAGFAGPLAGAAFFMWAQAQSYRVVVEKISGPEFLGYLAVGFSIATSVAGILESLVQQLYLPVFYRQISGADKDARSAALSELAAKTIPAYLIYLFFLVGTSEYLASFLVAEKYRGVFVYARYGAFIEFFRMTANILASAAHSEMRTGVLIKPYLFGGISAVAGVYLAALSPEPSVFIPLALAASGLVTVSVMWYSMNSMVPLHLRFKPLLRYPLLSALFLPLVFVHARGFLPSLCLLFISGAYFSFLQYKAAGKWLGGLKFSSGAERGAL